MHDYVLYITLFLVKEVYYLHQEKLISSGQQQHTNSLQDRERNGENISEKNKESMLATTSDKNSCNTFIKNKQELLLILI